MRKTFTLMLLVLAALAAQADPIDFEQAKTLAQDYMKDGAEPTLVTQATRNAIKAHKLPSAVKATAPYYIFSRGEGKGFVIVSGDDVLPEILGYTDQGDFDPKTAPSHVLGWLQTYAEAIENFQAHEAEFGAIDLSEAKAKRAQRKARRKAAGTKDIGPLMTSAWGQGWPYYDYCPWDDVCGNRSLTGCVATSTSSVAHYWRKDNPRYLMRTPPKFNSWTHNLWVDTGYEVGHPMKWELMPNSYSGWFPNSDYYTCTSELLAIVGAALYMGYCSNGSGAQSLAQPDALSYFNLTGNNIWRSGYSDDDWQAIIISNLESSQPILYSGYTSDNAGHAFVLDGYDVDEDKYHFDFGWNGSYSGYYTLDDANGFGVNQSMTCDIHPNKLNLNAEISAEDFAANTSNTVTVTASNGGTLPYTGGIYLFLTTTATAPTSTSDAIASTTSTLPIAATSSDACYNADVPGDEVSFSATVNPGSGDCWYLTVTDGSLNILARKKVPETIKMVDVTDDYIKNPSFESYDSDEKPTDWTLGGDGIYSRDAQNNIWRAVGHDGLRVLDSWLSGDVSSQISQTLTLPAGTYKLTAKVATHSGYTVTMYAGEQTAEIGVHECGMYYLSDAEIDNIVLESAGTLEIGMQAGHWYKVDDFRLYKYVDGATPSAAIDTNPAASAEEYFDITDAMAPWLSTANIDKEWTNDGFSRHDSGNYANGDAAIAAPFFEKWVYCTKYLDNASLQQTIEELPAGDYYIGGSFIATNQGYNANVEGVYFWAGDQQVEVSTNNGQPEIFSVKVTVGTDGTLTYGLKTDCTNANWVVMDNLFLYWAGDEDSYFANASEASPVRVPISNPRMEESLSGWTISSDGALWTQTSTYDNFTQPFMESWTAWGSSLADMSAKQTPSLRAGTYKLRAAVNAVQQNNSSLSVSGVNLQFATASTACHTANGKPEIFETAWTTVEEGKTELGLSISSTDANWVAWDNVVLYCSGSEERVYDDVYYNKQTILQNNGDATSLLVDPECDGLEDGWSNGNTITFCGSQSWKGVTNNNYIERTSDGSVTQTLKNMPAGTYKLVAALRAYEGGQITPILGGTSGDTFTGLGNQDTTSPQINLNGVQMPYCAIQGFYQDDAYSRGWQWGSATHTLAEDGTLTIAFQMTGTSWMSIDNVHLYYMVDGETNETLCESINITDATATETTVSKTLTADIITANPNLIIKSDKAISTDTGLLENNLATGTGTMAQLRLYDKYDLGISTAFTAENATYARAMSNTWGTVILPYAIATSDAVQLYQLQSESSDGSNLIFSTTESNAANTPVAFTKQQSDDTSITLSATNASVETTAAEQGSSVLSTAEGWSMQGYYTNQSIADYDGYYYIASDKFWAADGTLTIYPFRVTMRNTSSQAKSMGITIGEGTQTGISSVVAADQLPADCAIYDLQGRRVSRPGKGLYIINGQKVLLK